MRVPFGPFEPDKSMFNGTASASVVNVMPVANGWGPMPGLTTISAALGATCRGAVYVRDSSGNYTIIAGTETGLFKLNTTDYTWTDISGASAPYSLPLEDTWSFTVFGTKLVIHNIADPIQVYNIETAGVCADLAGSPPQAKYSWVSGDFLVLGYLSDTNGDKKVRWSGVNNIEHWTIGEQGADEQVIPEGKEVCAGFGEQGGFFVICRSAMHFFQFAPSSGYTFVRQLLNAVQGTISPRSVVSIGPGQFFYLSEDGFFAGAERKPIGAERVDRWFLDQIDMTYIGDVQGAADPFEKIVWWKYQVPSGTSRRLGYDWQLDRWCTTDLQVGEIVPLVTPGVTIDGMDALYASIDEVDVPFDSRLFLGGRPTLATFTSDNELAFFSGDNIAATLSTSTIEPDPVSRAYANGVRIVTDANGSSVSVTDTLYDYHGAAGVTSGASTMNRAGFCPMRVDGRLHRFTTTISQGAEWSIVSEIEIPFQASGSQ